MFLKLHDNVLYLKVLHSISSVITGLKNLWNKRKKPLIKLHKIHKVPCMRVREIEKNLKRRWKNKQRDEKEVTRRGEKFWGNIY